MNTKNVIRTLIVLLILAGSGSGFVYAEETRTITDMMGREVVVPADIQSVICDWLPSQVLVYTVAPDKLAAWNSPPASRKMFSSTGTNPLEGWNTVPEEERYFSEKYGALPIIGQAENNVETILSMHPDVFCIYYRSSDQTALAYIEKMQQKLGSLPIVVVKDTMNINGFSAPIRFMGDLLGEGDQAEEMNAFYEKVVAMVKDRVASIPESERVRVYYTQGVDGLTTSQAGNYHSSPIELCGGINVVEPDPTGTGWDTVSMEQVLNWDPEVILIREEKFYESIKTDPAWKDITAVKNGRVYLIPWTAYNWFDGPPAVNRIIGIPWTAKTLYPEYFEDIDLEELVREYHEIFYHVSLSDDQIQEILNA